MNKTINFTNLSASISPKERAKLVIELTKKGIKDVYPDLDKPLSTEADIQKVIAGCPISQAKDYNFLISLKNQVWERLLPLLEITTLDLEVLVSRFHLYLLVCIRDEPGDTVSAEHKEAATAFSQAITSRLSDIANYQAIINKIQDDYFDGLVLSERSQISDKINNLVDEYNLMVRIYGNLSKIKRMSLKPISIIDGSLSSLIDPEIVRGKIRRFLQLAQTRR